MREHLSPTARHSDRSRTDLCQRESPMDAPPHIVAIPSGAAQCELSRSLTVRCTVNGGSRSTLPPECRRVQSGFPTLCSLESTAHHVKSHCAESHAIRSTSTSGPAADRSKSPGGDQADRAQIRLGELSVLASFIAHETAATIAARPSERLCIAARDRRGRPPRQSRGQHTQARDGTRACPGQLKPFESPLRSCALAQTPCALPWSGRLRGPRSKRVSSWRHAAVHNLYMKSSSSASLASSASLSSSPPPATNCSSRLSKS
jgi:hypothetical protein